MVFESIKKKILYWIWIELPCHKISDSVKIIEIRLTTLKNTATKISSYLLINVLCTHNRVTSLEQLSVAEFSVEKTRLKVYEYGHKKVLGIWLDLVLKVKYSKILIFKAIFLCQKSAKSLRFFFIEEYKNGQLTFIIDTFW